jgi:hypothetical protein
MLTGFVKNSDLLGLANKMQEISYPVDKISWNKKNSCNFLSYPNLTGGIVNILISQVDCFNLRTIEVF